MKTTYSRLFLALISTASLATTIGLSASPGLSLTTGDECTITQPTDDRLYENETVTYWDDVDDDNVRILTDDGTPIVVPSYAIDCGE